MSNSELYKAGREYHDKYSCAVATDFGAGALWLLEQLEKKKLILIPGGDLMFAHGYDAGQESVINMARRLCGKKY